MPVQKTAISTASSQMASENAHFRALLTSAFDWLEGDRSPTSNPCEAIRAALAERAPDNASPMVDRAAIAHELWAAAQLSPQCGVEDGISRIIELLATYFPVKSS